MRNLEWHEQSSRYFSWPGPPASVVVVATGPSALPGLLLVEFCPAKPFLDDGEAAPYLVRSGSVLCRVLDVPHGQRQGGPALVFVFGDLLLHVVVVVVDEHAGDVSEGVQCIGCLGHPPLLLDVDEVGDLQIDAL